MDIVLDLSQNTINRTAIYFIARDVEQLLQGHAIKRQYFGHCFSAAPSAKTQKHLKQMFFSSLPVDFYSIGADFFSRDCYESIVPTPTSGVRRLFFDPLYVNYSPLSREDIVLVLDTTPLTYPHWHNPRVSEAYAQAYAKILKIKPKLMAISHNTAQSLFANFGYGIGDVEVIHLYVPRHFEAHIGVPPLYAVRPYFLFTGNLEYRKNLLGAVESFRCSGLYEEGYQLLIVGGKGHGNEAILARIENTPGVSWCGYLSNQELAACYAGAVGFVYPSYLEGFGVPLLEALSFGLPCVASTNGACPEVGGHLTTYIEPDNHMGFAEAMRAMVAMAPDARSAYAAQAKRWVQENFSFEKFASKIIRAILE